MPLATVALFSDGTIGRGLGLRPGDPIEHVQPRQGRQIAEAIQDQGREAVEHIRA